MVIHPRLIYILFYHFFSAAYASSPDPWDLSWVKNYTALGDSYGAGLGAGKVIDKPCSRYDQAYPEQVNAALDADAKYATISCSGWTLEELIELQIPRLADNSLDLITVSAGGNDVFFSEVISSCIYIGGLFSDPCQAALQKTRDAIPGVGKNVAVALKALFPKLRPGGVVIWSTYARFWNEHTTPCNDLSWDMLGPLNPGSDQHLTQDRRALMNNLTLTLNTQIKNAVNAYIATQIIANIIPGVTNAHTNIGVAEWDSLASNTGGLFCDIPWNTDSSNQVFLTNHQGTDNPDRTGDDLRRRYPVPPDGPVYARGWNGTYSRPPGSKNGTGPAPARSGYSNAWNSTHPRQPSLQNGTGLAAIPWSNASSTDRFNQVHPVEKLSPILPDWLTKVFHPTAFGQSLITMEVFTQIANLRKRILNYAPPAAPTCGIAKPQDPPDPNLSCYGLQSDGWTPSSGAFEEAPRDLASYVSDFCDEATKEWPAGNKWQKRAPGEGGSLIDDPGTDFTIELQSGTVSKDRCVEIFTKILSCETITPDNPFGLKHGGKYSDHQGGSNVTYSIDPLSQGMVKGAYDQRPQWPFQQPREQVVFMIPPNPRDIDRPTLQACLVDRHRVNDGQFHTKDKPVLCGGVNWRIEPTSSYQGTAADCFAEGAKILSYEIDRGYKSAYADVMDKFYRHDIVCVMSYWQAGTPKLDIAQPKQYTGCADWDVGDTDQFDISGRNWPTDKLGINGTTLFLNLFNCGIVENWKFDWLHDDPNAWEWRATGNVWPMGKKACIGDQMVQSGGQYVDQCWGPG